MASGSRATREIAFDLLKGIGIAEVFIHHSLSSSARKFYAEFSPDWWTLMVLNRILHFAIPTFLLASSVLLARSLAKGPRPNLRRYAWRRMLRTVWPYVVWSGIYLVFRAFVVQSGADSDAVSGTLLGLSFSGPRVLVDAGSVVHDLVWGKSFYHLYFLVVLIQLSVLMPALVWMLKGRRLTFGAVVALAAVVQLAVYGLQAAWWRAPYPASLAAWYVPAIVIGVWLGMNWSTWPALWRRNRRWIVAATAVAVVPHLWASIQVLRDAPVDTRVLNVASCVYGTGMALALLGWASHVRTRNRPVRAAVSLGAMSLPLFVIHPAVMYFCGGPTVSAFLRKSPGTPILALVLLVLATLAVTVVLIAARLDGVLFGRSFRRERVATPLAVVEDRPVAEPAAVG